MFNDQGSNTPVHPGHMRALQYKQSNPALIAHKGIPNSSRRNSITTCTYVHLLHSASSVGVLLLSTQPSVHALHLLPAERPAHVCKATEHVGGSDGCSLDFVVPEAKQQLAPERARVRQARRPLEGGGGRQGLRGGGRRGLGGRRGFGGGGRQIGRQASGCVRQLLTTA